MFPSRRTRAIATRGALTTAVILLCASALSLSSSTAVPSGPNCTENVHTGYAGQPTTTGTFGARWSANGRFVVYTADSITGMADTNGVRTDAVLRDRQGGALEIVSRTSAGAQLNADSYAVQVSDDGR